MLIEMHYLFDFYENRYFQKGNSFKILTVFICRGWDTKIFYFHALLLFVMDLDYFHNWKERISV